MKANDKHLSAKETIKKLDDIFAQKQEIRNSEDAEDDNTENFDAKGSLTKQVGELKNKLYSINKDMVVLESNDN